VISSLLAVAKEKGAKEVAEAKIKLGKMQQIDIDILNLAFRELTRGTLLEKTKIKVEPEETRFRCRACGHEWNFEAPGRSEEEEAIHFVPELAHSFLRCPRCRSPDFEIMGGRGVWVEYIKISR